MRPDTYNRYGAQLEYDVDMDRVRKEFVTLRDGLALLIPGANFINGKVTYEFKRARIIIDDVPQQTNELFFSPDELESIRMVDASPPVLVITTKSYAGTDTTSTIKLKEVKINAKKANDKPDLSTSSNLHGGGNADQVIMGDKLGNCVTLADCLNGRVFWSDIWGRRYAPKHTRTKPSGFGAVDGVDR